MFWNRTFWNRTFETWCFETWRFVGVPFKRLPRRPQAGGLLCTIYSDNLSGAIVREQNATTSKAGAICFVRIIVEVTNVCTVLPKLIPMAQVDLSAHSITASFLSILARWQWQPCHSWLQSYMFRTHWTICSNLPDFMQHLALCVHEVHGPLRKLGGSRQQLCHVLQ
jgi:hypothetical protein